MEKAFLLKSGTDTVGTILFDTFENWHNYGRLQPGPDYERYRQPLEQVWETRQVYKALFNGDNLVPGEDLKQAENDSDQAEEALEKFNFYLEETDTAQILPIHDFRPDGDHGSVYWRWGNEPVI